MTRSLSIVIPAYNEEQRLPATLDRVLGYLEEREWSFAEIIVVDDGSRDGTAAAASRYPKVRVLSNPGNRGKGYSVRHGMLESKGEWALFTDADLSTPIEELDKLFAAVEKDRCEVAIGSRALDRSLIGLHQSFLRENAGRLFNLMVRLFAGLPFWDTQCGFKLFHRRAVDRIFPKQVLEGFGFDVEVLFLARRNGFRAAEVPVRWNHSEGTKVRMFRDSLRMFTDVLRVRWNQWKGLYG